MKSVALGPAWGARIVLLTALAMAACTSSQASRNQASGAGASPDQPQRTLVVGLWGEPASLASVPVRDSGNSVRTATRLFNAELQVQDALGVAHPYLGEENPRLNSDTWQLFPDGRMETRYRLRANLTWHDGT